MLLTFRLDELGFDSQQEQGAFLFTKREDRLLDPIECLSVLFPGGLSGRSVKLTSIWGFSLYVRGV
jgi:hypothetical protein